MLSSVIMAVIFLAALARSLSGRAVNHCAVIFRQTEVLERIALVSARKSTQSVFSTHFSSAARLAFERATRPFTLPIDSAHLSASIASSTQSMGSLIAGIIFSGLGLIYFRYGKINHRYSTLICGILLMALPFFISNVLYLSLACIAVAVYPLFG